MRRALSQPEKDGWRQMWDGWDICPDCIAETLGKPDHAHRNGEWPVPADYSMAIKETAKCCKCDVRYASGECSA